MQFVALVLYLACPEIYRSYEKSTAHKFNTKTYLISTGSVNTPHLTTEPRTDVFVVVYKADIPAHFPLDPGRK